MNLKILLTIVIVLIALLLSGCLDSSNTIVGKYISEKSADTLELFEDSTFIAEEKSKDVSGWHNFSYSGTYSIKNKELILKYNFMGLVFRYAIENGTVIVNDKNIKFKKEIKK